MALLFLQPIRQLAMAQNQKPKQLEVVWGEPESFTLVVQNTTDGDRVAAEAAQRDADRRESDKLQQRFA